MSVSPLLLFLVGVVVVGTVAVLAYVADSKRRERLFAAATARGWTYAPEMRELVDRWTGTPFGRGDSRRARDVLSGVWQGREFVAFTYSFETSSGSGTDRSTTTHRYGVAVLSLPAFLPTLEVCPESFVHRALDAVGISDDLEMESEDFNRAFRVSSRDPKFASDVLSARVMERLLAGPRTPWRIEGTTVLSWDDGALEIADVEARLPQLAAVIEAVPTFVWKDHGYDPGSDGSRG
jgi:hypothetical protein